MRNQIAQRVERIRDRRHQLIAADGDGMLATVPAQPLLGLPSPSTHDQVAQGIVERLLGLGRVEGVEARLAYKAPRHGAGQRVPDALPASAGIVANRSSGKHRMRAVMAHAQLGGYRAVQVHVQKYHPLRRLEGQTLGIKSGPGGGQCAVKETLHRQPTDLGDTQEIGNHLSIEGSR